MATERGTTWKRSIVIATIIVGLAGCGPAGEGKPENASSATASTGGSAKADSAKAGPAKAGPAKAASAGTVRAWRIEAGAVPTDGPLATAAPGDLAMSDGAITLVVSSAERGGKWIDLARAADRGYDYLGSIVPAFIIGGRAAEPNYRVESVAIDAKSAPDKPAIIVRSQLTGAPTSLSLATRYEMLPSSGAIVVTTTVTNSSSKPIDLIELGDIADWGANYTLMPGPRADDMTGTWLVSFQDNYSLGVTVAKGEILASFAQKYTALIYQRAALKPNERISYRRYFPVRDRDLAGVSEFAWRLRRTPLGRLAGEVREAGTGTPVEAAFVEILSGPTTATKTGRPQAWTTTDAQGRFALALPPGRYFAMTNKTKGRMGDVVHVTEDVVADRTTTMRKPLQVSPPVMLKYEVRDAETSRPLPCKLLFQSFPNTPPADFGPEWGGPGARDVYYSATGVGEINLSAGRYRAYVSRGIEYDIFEKDIEVRYGKDNRLDAQLNHVVKMDGYVSVDVGVRTSESSGTRVSPADRVVAAAGEGVNWIVSGDVDTATDLAKAAKEAGVSDWVSAIVGRRVVWRGANAGAEIMVFPVKPGRVDEEQLKREAAATSPGALIAVLRKAYPDSLIGISRATEGAMGYLSSQNFSVTGRRFPKVTTATLDFDLYEIVSGRTDQVHAVTTSRRMYIRLLRELQRRYGMSAGSDSRYVRGNEVGYPRVYVPFDAKATTSAVEQIRQGLLSARALVTNGPIIEVEVNGQPPGSFVTDTDGTIDVLLRVRAAPWINVKVAQLYDGEAGTVYHVILPESTQTLRYPRSENVSPILTLPRGLQISGPYKHDVIITGVVAGDRSLAPVVGEDAKRGFGAFPFAVTGPIFVDINGDGKCTPPDPYSTVKEKEEF